MIGLTRFIDFDKNKRLFYDNLYLDDYKLVVKFPLVKEKEKTVQVEIKRPERKRVKIDRFDLTKYTYILSYD